MTYQTHPPAAVQELLTSDSSLVYIDVRTVEEFTAGHVPGSYNIPIFFLSGLGMQPNPAFLSAVTRHFTKDQKIVFGCKSGGRSARACELLAQHGYAHLINMAGGFVGLYDMSGNVAEAGWAACGFDTAKVCEPGRSWDELSKP